MVRSSRSPARTQTEDATYHPNAQVHVGNLAFDFVQGLFDADERAGIGHAVPALVHLKQQSRIRHLLAEES
jgi:hypothetical protein